MDKVFNLIILGPQGSGKGTQAELLQKKLSAALFGAGDTLRDIAKQNTELGRLVHQTINVEGKLLEPELITRVMKERIQTAPKDKNVIIEGYPRSVSQYELFKQFWTVLNRGDFSALFIDLGEEDAVKRLMLRKRIDDTESAIRQRLQLFYSETLPMVKAMEVDGKVIRINGAPSIEEVHKEILEKLNLK